MQPVPKHHYVVESYCGVAQITTRHLGALLLFTRRVRKKSGRTAIQVCYACNRCKNIVWVYGHDIKCRLQLRCRSCCVVTTERTEASRAKQSATKKQFFKENPEAGRKQAARLHTPEVRQKALDSLIIITSNPDFRLKQSDNMRQFHKCNPEARLQQAASLRLFYEHNPEAKQKTLAKLHTPQARARIRKYWGSDRTFYEIFTATGELAKTLNKTKQ